MRFLARFLDDYYAEHGTTFFRRVILSFIFGCLIGALGVWKTMRKSGMSSKEMGLFALGMGVAVMIVASFTHVSSALWRGGILGKLGAIIVFLMGGVAVLVFILLAASKML